MSIICLKLELVFDNNQAWGNVGEFAQAFNAFLQAQSLQGETILTGNQDLNNFYILVSKGSDPIMKPMKKTPTVKQSLKAVQDKAKGGENG